MKYLHKESNLNILGSWNPAILQPMWFIKEFDFIEKKQKIPIELLAGPAAQFRFTISNILISPSVGRLMFTPENDSYDVLEFILKLSHGVYEKLYHTPILATGHNFVYELEDNESFTVDTFLDRGKQENYYQDVELFNFNNCSFTHSFSFPDHILNVIYNLKSNGKNTIGYNFHYESGTTEIVLKAVDSFTNNFKYVTEDLNSKLIKIKGDGNA